MLTLLAASFELVITINKKTEALASVFFISSSRSLELKAGGEHNLIPVEVIDTSFCA